MCEVVAFAFSPKEKIWSDGIVPHIQPYQALILAPVTTQKHSGTIYRSVFNQKNGVQYAC